MSKTWVQKGEEMEKMSCHPRIMSLGWLSSELISSKRSKLLNGPKKKRRRKIWVIQLLFLRQSSQLTP